MFTYQLAYYAWLKLEVVEEKHDQRGTVRRLEEEVKRAVAMQKRKVEGVEEVEEGLDQGKKKGWWG